jgi:anti-sigma factor RsiW
MTTFFHSKVPERLAELEGQIKTLKAEFELALLKQKQAFEAEIEELENALLDRIEQGEKSQRASSLTGDKAKTEEPAQVGGYTKWSQRKQERISATADKGFPQRALRRAQRAPAQQATTAKP